jgi:hypothetical protein
MCAWTDSTSSRSPRSRATSTARADALTGQTTLPGQRVQVHNPPGAVIGQVATWGKATADRVDAFGFKWEWDGRSSKYSPFDWQGP